jgi:hypothetical protein
LGNSFAPEPERDGANTTILLVDADLGFVFWLGQVLDLVDHNALPAKNIRAADELIQQHKASVDVLVINPLLPNAQTFISNLRQSLRRLKVLAVIPGGCEGLSSLPQIEARKEKPRHFTKAAALEWVNLIHSLAPCSLPSGFR